MKFKSAESSEHSIKCSMMFTFFLTKKIALSVMNEMGGLTRAGHRGSLKLSQNIPRDKCYNCSKETA